MKNVVLKPDLRAGLLELIVVKLTHIRVYWTTKRFGRSAMIKARIGRIRKLIDRFMWKVIEVLNISEDPNL